MSAQVYLEGFFVRETLVTDGAFETFLIRMGHLVRFEQVLVAEAASANVAQERLLVRLLALVLRLVVDAVQRQRLPVDEVTPAHLALEHFLRLLLLAAVGAQALALLETPVARGTLVRTLFRVQVHVFVQSALVSKRPVARITYDNIRHNQQI